MLILMIVDKGCSSSDTQKRSHVCLGQQYLETAKGCCCMYSCVQCGQSDMVCLLSTGKIKIHMSIMHELGRDRVWPTCRVDGGRHIHPTFTYPSTYCFAISLLVYNFLFALEGLCKYRLTYMYICIGIVLSNANKFYHSHTSPPFFFGIQIYGYFLFHGYIIRVLQKERYMKWNMWGAWCRIRW